MGPAIRHTVQRNAARVMKIRFFSIELTLDFRLLEPANCVVFSIVLLL